MSAAAVTALMMNSTAEASHAVRFSAALLGLTLLHLLQVPRLWVCREFVFYFLFVLYTAISLLWARDIELGAATLLMSCNFVLILLLFGALFTYYRIGAVLAGAMLAFAVGAVRYTLVSGFPFAYPEEFSYNTVAGMYLFGLFLTVLFGWQRRAKLLAFAIGATLLLHILATTSIKTNVGIVLGAGAAGLIYFRASARMLLRGAIPLLALIGLTVYGVVSNPALLERVQAGYLRVSMGVTLLAARDDRADDNIGIGTRENWKDIGLEGWAENPVFGHGVEGFRADVGITSHSTPIDLLYNSGLIGFGLFGAMFASMAWRLLHARSARLRGPRIILIAALVCYLFMLLSAALYYDAFLAAFIAIGTALIQRLAQRPRLEATPASARPPIIYGSRDASAQLPGA